MNKDVLQQAVDALIFARRSLAPYRGNTAPIDAAIASLESALQSRPKYRHKRTGGVYVVIGTANLQTDKPLFDMAEVVAYRGEDGRIWVRAAAEFDERFERIGDGNA